MTHVEYLSFLSEGTLWQSLTQHPLRKTPYWKISTGLYPSGKFPLGISHLNTPTPGENCEKLLLYEWNKMKWSWKCSGSNLSHIKYIYYSEKFSATKATNLIKVLCYSGKHISLIQLRPLQLQIYLPPTLSCSLESRRMNCNIIHILTITVSRK